MAKNLIWLVIAVGLITICTTAHADNKWLPASPWSTPTIIKDGDSIPGDSEGSDTRVIYYNANGADIFLSYSCLYSNLESGNGTGVTSGDTCSNEQAALASEIHVEAPYAISYRNKNERAPSVVLRSGKRAPSAKSSLPIKISVKPQTDLGTEFIISGAAEPLTFFCKYGRCSSSKKDVTARLQN